MPGRPLVIEGGRRTAGARSTGKLLHIDVFARWRRAGRALRAHEPRHHQSFAAVDRGAAPSRASTFSGSPSSARRMWTARESSAKWAGPPPRTLAVAFAADGGARCGAAFAGAFQREISDHDAPDEVADLASVHAARAAAGDDQGRARRRRLSLHRGWPALHRRDLVLVGRHARPSPPADRAAPFKNRRSGSIRSSSPATPTSRPKKLAAALVRPDAGWSRLRLLLRQRLDQCGGRAQNGARLLAQYRRARAAASS